MKPLAQRLLARNGWRNSTPVGYLNPALKRANLTVLPNALAADRYRMTAILFDTDGDTFHFGGEPQVVEVRQNLALGTEATTPRGLPGTLDILRKCLSSQGIDGSQAARHVGEGPDAGEVGEIDESRLRPKPIVAARMVEWPAIPTTFGPSGSSRRWST